MPQCKMFGCKEPALPTGKRYCKQHKTEYLAKQAYHTERKRDWPYCPDCGDKVNPETNRYRPGTADTSTILCATCYDEALEQYERGEQKRRVERELYEVDTVEDLKTFIMQHIIRDNY